MVKGTLVVIGATVVLSSVLVPAALTVGEPAVMLLLGTVFLVLAAVARRDEKR